MFNFIPYLCILYENSVRIIYQTKAFNRFFASLSIRTQKKVDSMLIIVEEEKVIHSKIVKKIKNSEFYELRIRTDNSYRVIIFAIDHDNFIEATEIVLLNGFTKKSKSDYKSELLIANSIKKNFIDNEYKK